MGSSQTKFEYSLLTEIEKPVVVESFKIISRNSKYIKKSKLMKFWDMQVDPQLLQYIANFLFTTKDKVSFTRFAGLFVYGVRGSLDERIKMLKSSMKSKKSKKKEEEVNREFIKEYVKAVVISFMRILRLEHGHQYKSWTLQGFRIIEDHAAMFAEFLTHADFPSEIFTRSNAESWFSNNPIFLKMLENVFFHLYNYRGNVQIGVYCLDLPLLPSCENENFTTNYAAFLDLSQVLFINSQLPYSMQSTWRILFSSRSQGHSFGGLLRQIMHQGPTVLIIEDMNGYIFGGYASDSWAFSSNFVGNDQSFLFTLKPNMRSFQATNFNDHYQYLNLNQHTMPNGLGLGGQFNYWGLWIDSEFNGECSEACITYKNYFQLSATRDFRIKNIEVWGVGEKPKKENYIDSNECITNFESIEENKDSILSGSSMERAVLIASGKEFYSEGFIEEE